MKETRNTPQRELVYSLMRNNLNHPNADEIYELARKENPSISRGTVYRNLNLLAEQGLIKRLSMPQGPDHFDSITDEHCHFLCRNCHELFDAGMPFDVNQHAQIVPPIGFTIERCKLIIIGLCADCNK